MLAFDPEVPAERNVEDMMEAASAVETGQVTFAARDSEFGGHKIHQNDILGMRNGKLTMVEKDPVHTVYRLTKSMVSKDTSFVTIIYGEDVTEQEAQEAYDRIRSKVSENVEVTLINGGQPVYYFIVSVE